MGNPTPLNLLTVMILGLYDTDDPKTRLVGNLVNNGARAVKIEGSGKQMNYAAKNGLFVIGRSIAALEEPMAAAPPGPATAKAWVDDCFLPWVKDYGGAMDLVYFQGRVNEPGNLEPPRDPKGFDWLRAYADEEAERCYQMSLHGFKACVGNFSAEARLRDKVNRFMTAIDATRQYAGVLSHHCYGSRSMLDGAVDEFVFPEEYVAASILKLGHLVPAMVNGEAGIDSILSLGRHYDGWRVTGYNGYEYMDQLVQVSNRKKAKGLVKAMTVFVDDYNPGGNWVQYNTHGGKPARPKQGDPGEPAVTTMILTYHRTSPDGEIVRPVPGGVVIPPNTPPNPVQSPQPGYNGWARAIAPLNVRTQPTSAVDNVVRVLVKDEKVKLTGVQANGFATLEGGLNLTGNVSRDGVKPVTVCASAQYLETIEEVA